MLKKLISIVVFFSLSLCFSSIALAVPQDVDSNENYGADGNPAVDGANFSATKTLSVASGNDFGATAGASITQSTGSDNKGEVNFAGNSNVNGTVGTVGAALKTFALGGGVGTTVAINGISRIKNITVGAGTLDLNGSWIGSKITFNADGTATVSDNSNITGKFQTGTNNQGTVTYEGTSTTSANIGTSTNKLKAVNAGANGETATFDGKVRATTTTVTGTGTIDLNGNLEGTTVNFAGDGTVTVADTKDVDAAVTTNTNGTGTLTLEGKGTVSGQVGTAALSLKAVNGGGTAGKTSTFSGDVFTTTSNVQGTGSIDFNGSLTGNLNFTADGTANLAANKTLTGTVTTATNNTGTFEAKDGTTVTGDVGAVGTVLKQVKSNETAFNGDTHATTFIVNGGDTATIASGKNIFATNIDGESAAKGTLTFLGGITTQAKIGTNTQLKILNLGNDVLSGGVFVMDHDFNSSKVRVNKGSTLSVTGARTVTGDLNVKNGNTLSLGANTLTVTGTHKQSNNSNLNLSLNSATVFGNVVSGGDATVKASSNVNVSVASGAFIPDGTTFKIVDGAAASGNVVVPGTLTSNSAALSFTGTTDGDDLTLTATRTGGLDSRSTSGGGNAAAVGKALENAGSNNPSADMQFILGQLDSLSDAELDEALNQLFPDTSGAAITAVKAALNSFIGTTGSHLSGFHGSNGGKSGVSTGDFLKGVGIWLQGYGNHMDQGRRKGIDGYQANTFGTIIGLDKLFNEALLFGVAFGFGWTDINSKNTGNMETDIASYQGSLYSSWTKDNWYVDGFMNFAHNEYDGKRQILFGGVNRTANSDYGGQQYSWKFEGGYDFDMKGITVTPIASFQYSFLQVGDYTETGAGALNLAVGSEGYHTLEQGLGLKIGDEFTWKSFTVTPSIRALWYYDYKGERSQTTASLGGGGTSFDTRGANPAQHALNVGAEIIVASSDNWEVTVNYEGTLKDEFQSHAYFGTIRYEF